MLPLRKDAGPMESLCHEIGFEFDKRLEQERYLVAFVTALVSEICTMRGFEEQLSTVTLQGPPSNDSALVLERVYEMLLSGDLKAASAAVHDFIDTVHSDEAYPTDHLIDMLSSCVSAIRFGLEVPCRSRHAANAAQHVWRRLYGCSRSDRHSSKWEYEWARSKLLEAIIDEAERVHS